MGGIGRTKARGAPILKADMAKLVSLKFRGLGHHPSSFGLTQDELDRIRESGIKDWTGIEHATSLSQLWFNNVDLSEGDLSPLAGLSRLSWVNLDKTKISDLSPLVGLQLSEGASFSQNKISDISPLLKIMTSGSEVHFHANPLSRESINTHIPALRNMGVAVEFSLQVSSQQIYNDNVFVLPIAENLAAGNLPLADYSAHFYEHFSDQFDFLIFIPNLTHFETDRDGWNYFGRYHPVYNDLKGIGKGSYFNSEYGSAQKLQAVITFSEIMTDGFNPFGVVSYLSDGTIFQPHTSLYYGPFLHEVMHRWANSIIEPEGHWTWNSANGILGGFDIATLVDHGDGRYSANGSVPDYDGFSNGGWAGNYIPYSPIELYLAGLIPPEEVPDLWVAGGQCIGVVDEDGYWDNKSFITHQARTYTIEDIIAEHGPRIPDHTQSQKNFRAAVILLISEDFPVDTRILDLLSEEVSLMSHAGYDQNDKVYNFYEATGGRATITMDGLSSLKRQGAGKRLVPSSYGTPPPIVECEIDHHGLLQPHIH